MADRGRPDVKERSVVNIGHDGAQRQFSAGVSLPERSQTGGRRDSDSVVEPVRNGLSEEHGDERAANGRWT